MLAPRADEGTHHAYAIHRLSRLLVGLMIGPMADNTDTAEYQAVSRFLTALVVRDGATAAREQKPHCTWSLCDQGAGAGLWETTCGQKWSFYSETTPRDRKQRFCAYCGGILLVVRFGPAYKWTDGAAHAPKNEGANE